MSNKDRIERFFEPVARSIVRNDAPQIMSTLNDARQALRTKEPGTVHDESLVVGEFYAIEGISGIRLASAQADKAETIVEHFEDALPILHALGLKVRAVIRGMESKEASALLKANDPSLGLSLSQVVNAIEAGSKRVERLLENMEECGLVFVQAGGEEKIYIPTERGMNLLESKFPGWQLTPILPKREWLPPLLPPSKFER